MGNFFRDKTVQAWLWLFILLLLWEISSRLGLVNTYILPPLSKVLADFVNELFVGRLTLQILNSIFMIVCGLVISFFLAVLITALCVRFKTIESLFNMLSTIMNPLPSVALMPLIIMWFGINIAAMFVLIIHGVLWALIRHLLDGLRSISPVYYEWGKNIGISPLRMFTDILVFAIMPEVIAGLRVGWGRAWRALLSAEMVFGMIGDIGGLGYYIYTARSYANLTNVMIGVVVIIVIGISVESLLFAQIEKHTVQKWGMMRS